MFLNGLFVSSSSTRHSKAHSSKQVSKHMQHIFVAGRSCYFDYKTLFLSSVFFTVEIFRHLPLNRKVRWGTLDDFTTSFLHFSLFSTALWNFANSSPIHSLMLSSNLFLCLPCLLPPFTVPCKMVLVRPDERETCTYHFSLRPITMVRRSSCGSIACWILAQTSSFVKWSLYEMCSVLR